MSEVKQYAERDLMAMDIAGNHYCRHVSAMTGEQLHSKSDIAAELGWRDMQIAELKAQRDALMANEGYKQAFYEIAEILGIGARPDSPKNVFEQAIKPMIINLNKERGQLATENAALLIRLRSIIDIFSKADNRYCMCGESMDSHTLGGCGSPIGMLDYHFGKLTGGIPEAPHTDAYLNSVRDDAIKHFCQLIGQYGKVEPHHFNADFADLYAKINKGVYESILDNPAVYDMESLVDWLELTANDSRAYADMSIESAAKLRAGEPS